MAKPFIREMRSLTIKDVPEAGGKNASLGEMLKFLSPKGVNIPDGFVITATAYRHFISEGKVKSLKSKEKMEKWARKKVILTTPNGFLHQSEYDGNVMQEHKSGWSVDDFKKREYRVYGINGLKWLRGERGAIRFRPKRFWQLISDITQLIVYRIPSAAFQLFVVKDTK